MAKIQVTADAKIVKALCDRLVDTFEQFAKEQAGESEAGLTYLDALMGCHNFYKRIILDLEHRQPEAGNTYRQVAVDTLALSLGIPILRVKR